MEQVTNHSRELTPAKRQEVALANNIDRQRVFLQHLALYGVPTAAAKIASPHAAGSCLRTFTDLRDRDPSFASQWKSAVEAAHERILQSAIERGVDGYEEYIVSGGKVVDGPDGRPLRRKIYSDKILDRLLQRFPEFSTRKVEHSGTVNHQGQAEGRLFIAESDIYALSGPQRRNLIGILETITESRGETLEVDRINAEDIPMIETQPELDHQPEPWELAG